ncbi:MAG: bifunctional oligoribonuclease/PAP phosphatase NrnA [Melioribacteraceae bacterium]|nr:bifunctional oligoribonuclease/PAP phosphatase NrnA [Melioribacteraceae bacterium]
MQKLNELLSALKSHSTFIITSHVNPDADAIGSELAIAGVLKQLGKKYFILNTSITPYNLEFLDLSNEIQVYDSSKHDILFDEADAAIFLDLNHINRTVRIEEQFRKFKGTKICIDHHTEPENFGDFELIDQSKSSTGEIIYDIIDSSEELKFDAQIALTIYAAILTDTGSFRFSKTTAAVHRKVAKLLEFGLSPEDIYDKIYAQYEFSRIKLLGESLSSISITESGKVSYMIVHQENLLKCNGIESDVDGFVNFALTTSGVEIGILFFELADGLKISFRSKGTIPVNLLAKEFGGGGHVNASGTRLFDVTIDEILPKVLESAEKLV